MDTKCWGIRMTQDLSKPSWDTSDLTLAQGSLTNLHMTTLAESNLGFVYKITRISDGKFYIGKKLFWFKKTIKRKGKRNKKILVLSDYKTYWGSCKELIADIEKLGTKAFKREVLGVYSSKYLMSYTELQHQLRADIMNPKTNTYNGIINVRLRRPRK